MKKRKVFIIVALVVSLIGASSIAAAVAFTPKHGVKTIDADVSDVVNTNAKILDDHIGQVADANTLGHIKIGTGLQMTGDQKDTASVKIANDLTTNDSETALSAAMGAQLSWELMSGLKDYKIRPFDAYVEFVNGVGTYNTGYTGYSEYYCVANKKGGANTSITYSKMENGVITIGIEQFDGTLPTISLDVQGFYGFK